MKEVTSILLILGLIIPIVYSCNPDPCDSCNSEQVCNDGVCVSTGGDGGDIVDPCHAVTCGLHAHCLAGSCYCDSGYHGNPHQECSAVEPPTPESTPITTTTTTTTTTMEPPGPGPVPTPPPPPPSGGSSPIEQLLTRSDWDTLFPNRWHESALWHQVYNAQQRWYYPEMEIDYYSFNNFVNAVNFMAERGLGNFANEPGSSDEERKRELCAFFGNIAHETGEGESGLFYREEIGYERSEGGWNGGYYNKGSRHDYVLGADPVYFRQSTQLAGNVRFNHASYHGRGPLQLSHGYNYGDFSKAIFGDPQVLLDNPDKILDDPKLGISAAIWFWMTQPDWRMTHNPHKCMYKHTSSLHPWGFGRTIMAINGGLEGDSTENGYTEKDKKVTRRIKNYRRCAAHFGVPVGIDGEQLDTKGWYN